MRDGEVNAAYIAVMEYAAGTGARNLRATPGLWERSVDPAWSIAINPHGEEIEASNRPERMGCPVPPYAVAVWFNGWWAGAVTPAGGWMANGDAANLGAFLAALPTPTPAPAGGREE